MNSTMKLVRRKVTEFYGDRIELIYEDDAAHRQANIEALKKFI